MASLTHSTLVGREGPKATEQGPGVQGGALGGQGRAQAKALD